MENIRQAVERAKAQLSQPDSRSLPEMRPNSSRSLDQTQRSQRWTEVALNPAYLQSRRVVAFDGKDPRTRPFDILRAEVLRSMDLKGWRTLAVTSPTPNCGKTVTAINLALSLARQPERQVRLIDLDLRKPQVAAYLGLKVQEGVLGVIEGRLDVDDATVTTRAGTSRLEVLPTAPSVNSSDLVGSSAIKTLLQSVTDSSRSRIIILDLPPVLTGHDVISILPHVDCALLVAAVGTTKVAEIEECNKYLQATDVVRFVLNKVPESKTAYAYY
jgi:protein-tyrosine kinase